jgi:hypothetical protein
MRKQNNYFLKTFKLLLKTVSLSPWYDKPWPSPFMLGVLLVYLTQLLLVPTNNSCSFSLCFNLCFALFVYYQIDILVVLHFHEKHFFINCYKKYIKNNNYWGKQRKSNKYLYRKKKGRPTKCRSTNDYFVSLN